MLNSPRNAILCLGEPLRDSELPMPTSHVQNRRSIRDQTPRLVLGCSSNSITTAACVRLILPRWFSSTPCLAISKGFVAPIWLLVSQPHILTLKILGLEFAPTDLGCSSKSIFLQHFDNACGVSNPDTLCGSRSTQVW